MLGHVVEQTLANHQHKVLRLPNFLLQLFV
jgi:hypothetical protein